LGAVLCARRGWWVATVACSAAAMLSKEHGVATGVLIVLDRWLRPTDEPRYPAGLYSALGGVTAAFAVAWYLIGHRATSDGAALGGTLVVGAAVAIGWWARRAAPALSFGAWASAATYLPTSNLAFPSGIVLAERNLYLPVLLVAALTGLAVQWAQGRWGGAAPRGIGIVTAALAVALGWRTLSRL